MRFQFKFCRANHPETSNRTTLTKYSFKWELPRQLDNGCLVGNLIVIVVVTVHWRMRSITNFCLANLAFADFCVSIFCVYQNMYIYFMSSWVFGAFLCKMYYFITELSHTASILILVVICIERYLAIVHPMRCKEWLTLTRLRMTIIAVWTTSAIYSSPRLYFTNIGTMSLHDSGREETLCIPIRTLYDSETFDMISLAVLFVLPLLVISILYTRIAFALWESSKTQMQSSCVASTPPSVVAPESFSSGDHEDYVNNIARTRAPAQSNPTCSNILCCGFQWCRNLGLSSRNANVRDYSGNLGNKNLRKHSGMVGNDNCRNHSEMIGNENIRDHSANFGNGRPIEPIVSFKFRNVEKNKKNRVCKIHLNAGKIEPRLPERSRAPAPKVKRMTVTRGTGGKYGSRALESRRRIIKMLIIIVFAFAICNLPFHARKIWQYYGSGYSGGSTFSSIFTPLTFLIMYGNSGINPILYAFMSKKFRVCFLDLLNCKRRRGGRVRSPSVRSTHLVPPPSVAVIDVS